MIYDDQSMVMIPLRYFANAHAVWRVGFGPKLPVEGMKSLLDALVDDDQRLMQGSTTSPPPLITTQNWPCEAADAIGWCFFGPGATVGEVEEGFARACYDADMAIASPDSCRHIINFWDDTPRHVARAAMIWFVVDSLVEREEMSRDEAAMYKAVAARLDDQAPKLMLKDWKLEHA
jgi:hypothetical protein